MTNSTPSEGHGRGLPEDKAEDIRDELYQLSGLAVALDHCLCACGIVNEPDAPTDALLPLVQTLNTRLAALTTRIDRDLSNKETTT